jgi:O-antigen ligase
LIILAGLAEAGFGIYSDINDITIFPEEHDSNELRAGTFVNRNHFSNYLTMVLGLVLGLLTSIVNARTHERGGGLGRFQDKDIGALSGLIAIALVILAAVFTSGSRAPIVFFTLGYGVMLGLAYFSRRDSAGEFFLAPLAILGVALVIVLIGFDYSVMRLVDRDLFAGERMLQNVLGMKLFSGVWLTGVGAGAYRWAFTMFRNDDLRFVTYDHAHNDYVELGIEEGIIGLVLLGAATGLMLMEMYKGYRTRRNPWMRGVIFGCLMSTIYMLLHSLVEFNFRIPANAAYFFAIAALGLAACHIDRQQWQGRKRSGRHARREGSNG